MTATARASVLLIAFHYPPCVGSSGLQRTLAFSHHLRAHGWNPVVLTAHPGAYERTDPHQLADIPPDVPVTRAFAPDASRHFALGGRYWSRLAVPDRWRLWPLAAVPQGLALIRRHNVQAIWSTYPIATAHTIGSALARLTSVPWVADFRDPMVELVPETGEMFPRDPAIRNARLRIEAAVARCAASAVFCTESARRIFAERYPAVSQDDLHVIANGFEERAFLDAEPEAPAHRTPGRFVLLHSGTIYPGPDRDPTALFVAVRALEDLGVVTPQTFELRLRDPGSVEHFRALAASQGIADLVTILPPLPYRQALAEMLAVDALLLLQGFPSNPAIPAKLYEYLRAGRPMLAMVDPGGETAAALKRIGIATTCNLTDAKGAERLLQSLLDDRGVHASGSTPRAIVDEYSRERTSARLAELLATVAARRLRRNGSQTD